MTKRYTEVAYTEESVSQPSLSTPQIRELPQQIVSQIFPDIESLSHVYLIEEITIDRNILKLKGYLPNVVQDVTKHILACNIPSHLTLLIGSDDFLDQAIILEHDQLMIVAPRDNFIHRVITRAARFSRENISNNERLTGSILRETKSQLSKLLLNLSPGILPEQENNNDR